PAGWREDETPHDRSAPTQEEPAEGDDQRRDRDGCDAAADEIDDEGHSSGGSDVTIAIGRGHPGERGSELVAGARADSILNAAIERGVEHSACDQAIEDCSECQVRAKMF